MEIFGNQIFAAIMIIINAVVVIIGLTQTPEDVKKNTGRLFSLAAIILFGFVILLSTACK